MSRLVKKTPGVCDKKGDSLKRKNVRASEINSYNTEGNIFKSLLHVWLRVDGQKKLFFFLCRFSDSFGVFASLPLMNQLKLIFKGNFFSNIIKLYTQSVFSSVFFFSQTWDKGQQAGSETRGLRPPYAGRTFYRCATAAPSLALFVLK